MLKLISKSSKTQHILYDKLSIDKMINLKRLFVARFQPAYLKNYIMKSYKQKSTYPTTIMYLSYKHIQNKKKLASGSGNSKIICIPAYKFCY